MRKTDRPTLFCKRCQKEKPQWAFYPARTYACADCIKEKVRAYKAATDYNRRYKAGALTEHTGKTLVPVDSGCGTRTRSEFTSGEP